MLNNCHVYNAARCYEFCAHFLGSQKSPKIQTAPDSGTFRVSYTNTRITAVCQKKNKKQNDKQIAGYCNNTLLRTASKQLRI